MKMFKIMGYTILAGFCAWLAYVGLTEANPDGIIRAIGVIIALFGLSAAINIIIG